MTKCSHRLVDHQQSRWKRIDGSNWVVSYLGSDEIAADLLALLVASDSEGLVARLKAFLSDQPTEWSAVAISESHIFAVTDKIRSYPLFYTQDSDCLTVSNNARLLPSGESPSSGSSHLALEFAMAGYVTGRDTLSSRIRQLQAGEFLLFCLPTGKFDVVRYYRYVPQPDSSDSKIDWHAELEDATEKVFNRLISKAEGRTILVPLSGGLDSRLIVCMLRRLKYENVRTFSYGLSGNYEAKIAKSVASKLGYPWEYVSTTHAEFRDFFWSEERKAFWQATDGLCTVPTMQDTHALYKLKQSGKIDDVLLVNGQTGDFISGGHVPPALCSLGATTDDLVAAIISKHYGLQKNLLTPENIADMEGRVRDSLKDIQDSLDAPPELPACYESWEWQERQCKYVISWQRGYDWLGLDWSLPFWDADYLAFWSRVPFEMKIGQRLYKEYLSSRDYNGLFKNFSPSVWRWPGATIMAIPIGRLIGVIAGRKAKEKFYDYARYAGHYGPYYAPWGFRRFLHVADEIRNPVALFVRQWFEENPLVIER